MIQTVRFFWLFSVLFLVACHGGETPCPEGAPCPAGAECATGLECHYGRCRSLCTDNHDCQGGWCVGLPGLEPKKVCLFGSELRCSASKECPAPLSCSAAGYCTCGDGVTEQGEFCDHVDAGGDPDAQVCGENCEAKLDAGPSGDPPFNSPSDGGCDGACGDDGGWDAGERPEHTGLCTDSCSTCSPGWAGPSCETCVRFVRHDGPLDGDGLSWESAFPRIQDGIDAARHAWSSSDNLLACETWVAGGTYYSEYLVPVRLHPGVLVYGGFSGDGHECCREQRRVALHRTVLDGHASAAADAEQAYHVVQGPSPAFTTGLPADCVLDGFVITGGNAHSGDRGDNDHGGGLIVDGKMLGVGMTVRNTIFVDNSARVAGGAIAALDNTSMTLENCIFLRNSAIETAGAVLSAVIGAHVTVRNCDFLDGVAPNGGAVAHAFLGLITVYNSVFWGNELNVTGAFMGGETSIEYSLVEQEIGGEGNLYVPPMIESVDDPVPLPGSPLIDSANGCEAPVLDLRGNARINIAAADDEGILPAADMGAIEYVDGEHEPQGTQLEECCTSVEAPDNAEHIYWFCPSIRSWHRAQDVCAAHGAHLVTLGDAAEQELVLALVESSESPPEEFWLGGHDIAREGHWQWLSGEAWHDWSGFPPSANTDLQDCLVFNRAAGTWTAKLCRGVLERRQFVCESSP